MPNTFLYFAYGSNMLTRRLRAPKRAPSAMPVGTGFVQGHRLTFDKVSTDSSSKCSMEKSANPADRVYGVLFEVSLSDSRSLDDTEGAGRGYRNGLIQVVTPDAVKTAVTYFATERDPHRRPYSWYKALVLEGALEHGLPEAYVQALRRVASQPDPNVERRERNEALLAGKGEEWY
ncbi:gamma-glutamylcyclotransferase family protein [Nitrospira sp. BLG_2]|uniref:gamma-glutamylcyclotransferase family protein n=1 Tax=Nitrospira sp. BLG_2 TaxID=3397507 RepID=UPI003B9C4208